jgi:hypothetical protein
MARFGFVPGIVVLALGVAGCSSISEVITPAERGVASAPQASSAAPINPAFDPSQFRITGTCPRVNVLGGAETMLVYETGKQGDPAALRFQGSLTQTARECSLVGENTLIKVGVAGRVLSGPKGATGTVTLPVRVAVRRGTDVLYSQLHQVAVNVAPPDFGAAWSKVDEMVSIPAAAADDAQILVGFDTQAPAPRTPARRRP